MLFPFAEFRCRGGWAGALRVASTDAVAMLCALSVQSRCERGLAGALQVAGAAAQEQDNKRFTMYTIRVTGHDGTAWNVQRRFRCPHPRLQLPAMLGSLTGAVGVLEPMLCSRQGLECQVEVLGGGHACWLAETMCCREFRALRSRLKKAGTMFWGHRVVALCSQGGCTTPDQGHVLLGGPCPAQAAAAGQHRIIGTLGDLHAT